MAKRVLIVEDNPHILRSLSFLMEQAGYEVEMLNDGPELLTVLGRFQPQLLLLDLMLPTTNGFELCQNIRQSPDFPMLKIVMLTAKGRDIDVANGLSIGADLYITKPFSTRQLVQEIARLMNQD